MHGGSGHSSSSTGAGQKGIEGGVGANSIGLRVRVWANVTGRDTAGMQHFYIVTMAPA